MNQDIEDTIARGFEHAAIATSTNDPIQMQEAIQKALALLKPVSSPEYCVPRAAFGVGLIAHHMAMQVLGNLAMDEDERLTTAFQFFAKAGKYFGIAAGMADYQADLTPAYAKDALARLHELGVLEQKQTP